MKEYRKRIVSVFLVLLMTTTAFSVLIAGSGTGQTATETDVMNSLAPVVGPQKWQDLVQPSLVQKIKSKEMADILVATVDVGGLYNLVKDYRYHGLIGPDATPGELSVIRLKVDSGIIPDIASLPGVVGVYDPAQPIDGDLLQDSLYSSASSVNQPDSTSSTVEHMADKAWDLGYTGEGVRVATMDSGVDFAHYDLNGQQARVPATAEKKNDVIIESTDGSESGKSFALAYYPVVSGSVVLDTYNPETKEYGTIEPANYTVDYSNGIVTFNVNMTSGLQVSANYTYYSPYADWPMAFDPISMSSYLSSGGSASDWYVDTSTTDLHIYHPVVVDGVNDFWEEKDSLGGASSLYPINATTDLRGTDKLNDIQEPAFDLGKLYISTDASNFYFGFEAQPSLINMSYGIYINTQTGGGTNDPEGHAVTAQVSDLPEYAIYVPHVGVRWGVTAGGEVWSENDTVKEPRFYEWSGTSWSSPYALTTMGRMVMGEHVATGDATANDTSAQLAHSNISPDTFRLYINQTPFPSDGYVLDAKDGTITFSTDLPYLANITADYDYSPDMNNASDFARSSNFMEFRVPKNVLGNPDAIDMEVFTVGNNQSHAQDTTPSDPNVQYSSPDWSPSSSTILSSFASRNSTPVLYNVGDIPSKSGVYHIGYHPDENLATYFYGRPVAMLLTDEFQAGVYDTVYVDLDDDKDFTDERPASLFGAYKESEGISPAMGAKLHSNFTLEMGNNFYPLYKAYTGTFNGYQELIVGDGSTKTAQLNDTNIVKGSEKIYERFNGTTLTFENDSVVYTCDGSEGKSTSFYLPHGNIVNNTFFVMYYNGHKYLPSDVGYTLTVNNFTGRVDVSGSSNSPSLPPGLEFWAWFKYDKTIELSSPENYTVDWDSGVITMNQAPSSSAGVTKIIYATDYSYYFRNDTLYTPTAYGSYPSTAFIYKDGKNTTVEVRTETISKDADSEGLNGDGLPYPDLSGGMVYFISHAKTSSESLTARDGQTVFNLTHGNVNPSTVYVYKNSVLLSADNYSLSSGDRLVPGNITLSEPASSGDLIQVRYEYDAVPIPYSDVLSERTGVSNPLPANGNLVCLFGDFSADTSKGTEVASDIAAKGINRDGNGNTLVKGMAPGAKLIAIRTGDPFNGWYFGAEGYDGVPGSGDEAQIFANSFSYAIPQSGWDIYSRFADYITVDYSKGHTAIVSGAGAVGSYGYGTIGAPGAAQGVITVGVGTDFHYRNYNPHAPSDLMRLYGDRGPNAHDGDILPSSGRGPTMTGNPKPDIVASGAFCYGDTPLNVDQNMYSGAWEWDGGQWAWDLWSGDSLSAAIGAGGLALVYQAYYEAHGQYPDAQTAKNILKSGADNLNYDAFSQGAGSLNVYRACLIAAGTNGLSIDKTEWVPGNFHGTSYANFANLATPGNSYTQSFNITNQNQTEAEDVDIRGEIFHSFGQKTITMDMKKFYDDRDTPGVINIKPYIPERTEFLRVTASVPYADGYTNMMEFFDWTDTNGNGVLEFPGEQNRMEYCINSNMLQLTLRDPLSQVHNGLAIQIKDFGGTPVQQPWNITMEFFEKTDWDWMSIDPSHIIIPPGETHEVNTTLSIPADAPAGTYEGGIYITRNLFHMPVAVGDGYVMNYSDMWQFSENSNKYSVNNSAVTGEGANVLPGSAYFTFIPYHEVFDAPAAGIDTVNLTNTSASSYVLWHTVNSTVSGVSNNYNPGGGHNTSRDWHIMNESAIPGKYNYTIDHTNHTIKLNGWSLNEGERITVYFLNGSYNLTEGTDFTYPFSYGRSIALSSDIQNLLTDNPNSTVVASYIWSYGEGTWSGTMERNIVTGSAVLYMGNQQWNQYVTVTGEHILNASGGETELQLGNSSILLGSTTLYSNDTPLPTNLTSVTGETLINNSAAGGETDFNLAHGNVVSSTAKLYLNNQVMEQLAEVSVYYPEWCFDANSTSITSENITSSAQNISGSWILKTSHNLNDDMMAIKPGSYTLYEDGTPLTAGVDYNALTNSTDGLLTGEFEIYNYNSSRTYTVDYAYYNPYIKGGYLAHGNVVEDSYKIYRNGKRMTEGLEYTLNLTNGHIILTDPLSADEYITAAYMYNQYTLQPNGVLTLTDPLSSGDTLSIDYEYYSYLVDLPSGRITLSDPLEPNETITADYTYAVFQTDLVNGEVRFNNWLYPGTVVTGDYSVYESVIPVCVNIPVNFPDVHIGGTTALIQDMYNNSAIYGGSDKRFYFMDIPDTGLYKDPGNRQFLIDTKWESSGTDIDTTIYSRSSQTSYPGASLQTDRIGLYSLSKSGGSTATSSVFTTTGGPEEVLFSPMKNSLNVIQLQGTIMAGSGSYEPFNGSLGLIDLSDPEVDITTGSINGHESVSTTASVDRYGISGAAAGPSSPQSYPNEIVYQDDADWSHYDTFIDQLVTGKYTRAVEVSDSALIFDVHITSTECPDLDLAVFLDGDSNGDHVVDANDDPSYLDGKTEPIEFVAMCADADADEEVTLVTPAPGTYLIRVFGFDVPGGKNTFNLDITLVQGTGFKVSGQDSRTIPAYQPKELNITWNFDENSPDGTFMGAFYIGTYNAPMSLLLPVSLTLERTAPEITDVTPEQSTNVSTATPVIKASYDDPTANTGQDIVVRTHTAPAHLWGASDEEWKTTVSKAVVPGSGIDPTATRMYLDGQDISDKITSTDTVATYTPSKNLMDGVHTVRVIARDLAGNEVQKSWSFVVDTASPSVSVDSLSSEGTIYTQADSYHLVGHVDAGSSVTINGQNIEVSDDGSFSLDIPLNEGLNPVTIVVIDSAGNRNVQEIVLIKDTTAPSFSVSASGPRIRNIPVASITGAVDLIGEPGDVQVTVNGLPVVVHTDGSFSTETTLAEGENTITVVATDAAGNTASRNVSISVDTTAPSLSVSGIPEKVSTRQITISGTAEPGSKVYVNGKQVITTNGEFSSQVSLSPGSNIITVSAVDSAGNSVEQTYTVDYQPSDELSALTASSASQSAPLLSSAGGLLLLLVAIICLILGFVISKLMTSGGEGGAEAVEPLQETPVEEETETGAEEPEKEVFEESEVSPEESDILPEEMEEGYGESEEAETEPEISSEEGDVVPEQIEEEYEEAEEPEFETASPEISLDEAESLAADGDMVGAIRIYDSILEQEPDNIAAHIGKAKALNATGKWGKALQSISSVLERNPDNVDALVLKGDIFAERGNTEMARQAYTQALQIDPDNQDIAEKIQNL